MMRVKDPSYQAQRQRAVTLERTVTGHVVRKTTPSRFLDNICAPQDKEMDSERLTEAVCFHFEPHTNAPWYALPPFERLHQLAPLLWVVASEREFQFFMLTGLLLSYKMNQRGFSEWTQRPLQLVYKLDHWTHRR